MSKLNAFDKAQVLQQLARFPISDKIKLQALLTQEIAEWHKGKNGGKTEPKGETP